MQSVPITNKVVSSNPVYGKVYSLQHYVIKLSVSERLAAGWWFSPGIPVTSTNKNHCRDISEILLKVKLYINLEGQRLGQLMSSLEKTFFFSQAKKKYMCVYCHMLRKNLGLVGRDYYYIFFLLLLSAKPEMVIPGSGIQYFIFEISRKMTNYAVFLPSLLSISTKS